MTDKSPLFEACAEVGADFAEEGGWLVAGRYADVAQEYLQARQHAAIFDLSSRGKIELTGPDTASFLHNLSTNAILHLPSGRGCEAFFATLKAKIIAHAYIFRASSPGGGDSYWIDVAPAAADKLLKHLNHFLISEQVEISDRTRELAQIYVAGPDALTVLRQLMGKDLADLADLEQRPISLATAEASQLRRQDLFNVPGYTILCPGQQAEAVWRALNQAGGHPAGAEAFNVLRIEAGLPADGVDFDENCLIMEIGRTSQAISYTKGCYLGQEPVVRSRDLGHVNRTLLGVKIRARSALKPGTKLWRDGKEVGHLTSSAWSPRLQSVIGLAYIRRGNQDPGTLLQLDHDSEKTTAEVASLPFALSMN
ncbi:MAG TPA: aminomethyltransferase family protein [Gemmataceae bacterium]|nr:aminomethyltransferase family protein [Gemmataceae bacterium]